MGLELQCSGFLFVHVTSDVIPAYPPRAPRNGGGYSACKEEEDVQRSALFRLDRLLGGSVDASGPLWADRVPASKPKSPLQRAYQRARIQIPTYQRKFALDCYELRGSLIDCGLSPD